MLNQKSFYIETFGCQMNERDSEIMAQLLGSANHVETSDMLAADVVVVNTCSIRGKAEQKAYSLLGRLRRNKKDHPDQIIAVAGCVAQQDGLHIRERMPHVDLVIGPQRIYDLPELVSSVSEDRQPLFAVEQSSDFVIPPFLPDATSVKSTSVKYGFKRFVTIMQGCNNFCTYCVVPFTRGREISRRFEDILDEVTLLASHGLQEVTLLGQNVNSYRSGSSGTGSRNFADLLRAVAAVDGIKRLRFTTSHPKDLSEELMNCFAEVEKLCPHFHLPVQAGSDRILARMNRKYTAAQYIEKVERLRQIHPGIALTTDIIVGFPGETEADFEETMSLLEKIRYHGAFSFKYSDRPHARAALFDGKIDEDEKSRRLQLLQARQEEISLERNREFIGKTLAVMVEGRSKKTGNQWSGRTSTNHIVNFASALPFSPGQVVEAVIEEACQNSLRGRIVTKERMT